MTPDELRERAHTLSERGPRLAAIPLAARAAAIAEAARRLIDPRDEHGRALRAALAAKSGLSAPNVELGLSSTLRLFDEHALIELVERSPGKNLPGPSVVVLAGNVWSAAARPLLFPLACGLPVLAKASARDDVFPHALVAVLREVDRELAAACEVVTFERERHDLLDALLAGAGLVSVYGDDATVSAIAARVRPGVRVLERGHGIGAACIGRDALTSSSAAEVVAERLAVDVASYDQRGCLSPHAALVEAGGVVSARELAELLADALEALHETLPPGDDPEARGASMRWRSLSAAIGDLFVRDHAAVSFERDAPIRASPGLRQLAVLECKDLAAARARLTPLGHHLKALGMTGASTRAAVGALAPYACELGAMQAPPLDARLDGLDPLAGYRD